MLNIKKFLSAGLLSAGALAASPAVMAEIVDSMDFNTDFYMLENLDSNFSLYQYDMAAAGTTITRLFRKSGEATAMTFDGTTYFVASDNQIIAYDASGNETFIRNINEPAKAMHVVGNYLVVLLGNPNNAIKTYDKVTGAEADQSPTALADLAEIVDVYVDTNSRLIMQYTTTHADGAQFATVSLDAADGILGEPVSEANAGTRPTGFSGTSFYLDEFKMVVDDTGSVANLSSPPYVFAHGPETSGADSNQIVNVDNISTNSTIHAAADDAGFTYTATTLDNPCNPVDVGGTRITRHVSLGDGLVTPAFRYYDTENVIHTIGADSGTTFLFHGEGSDLAVEIAGNAEFSSPLDWRPTAYAPSQQPLNSANQNLAFAIDSTTIAMQIDNGCDHHVVFWNTSTQAIAGYTETYWHSAVAGAYAPDLDRIFIAWSDQEDKLIREVSTEQYESSNPSARAKPTVIDTAGINYLVGAGNYLVINTAEGIESRALNGPAGDLASQLSGTATDEETTTTSPNCCGTWEAGIYNSNLGRIHYATTSGLYSIVFNVNGTFGAVTQSRHYTGIQPNAEDAFMSLSEDESLLFLDGEIYDANTLDLIDSANTQEDVGVFIGDPNPALYTINIGEGVINPWTINANGVYEGGTATNIAGDASVLLRIGTDDYVTVSDLGNSGQIAITVNGDTANAATFGVAGSDADDDNDPDADPETDDTAPSSDSECGTATTCVKSPDGKKNSGGPVDLLLLTALLGLGARARLKQKAK